ncbi:MAG: helix-turn-helix transcriptional regulator [Oscillospiraceae bacterium]
MYRLKDLREDNDLNQTEIAKILNCTQACYSKWELGQRDIPISSLIKLAEFYNVTIDYLLGVTDKNIKAV